MGKLRDRTKSDSGFMGLTHSLSALAVFLLVIWLAPSILFGEGANNGWILGMAIVATIGGALMPDLDNTQSTAISSLGLVGRGLSKGMRAISNFIYRIIHGKRDNPQPDPHRGFWHTIVSALLVGGIVFGLTGLGGEVGIQVVGRTVSVGFIFACVFIFVCLQLTLASFFGTAFKKMKKNTGGKIVLFIVSIGITMLCLFMAPADVSYRWLAISIALGWLVHIIGDTFTVSGTPLFWPISHRGKRWWSYRIPPGVKAGGTTENYIFIPAFLVIIGISLFNIIRNLIQGGIF